MSEDYKVVEIKILNEIYKFKVNEPQEVIDPILEEIKENVEDLSKKIGKQKVNHILLLLLLNEKLNNLIFKEKTQDLLNEYKEKIENLPNFYDTKSVL
ncbi:hypothetical protein OSSY52_05820 [Tepiditoga spiralis]|uniref:Cell division protein ZapA n=1 Tax=Tepiditoga spiralis TaxID=2108365 RepID=A0A7G1G2A1_9BACT|nr:cell division protein ZapA [Tepiditoga spiralis]BBE30441.1 hypothetical protein OSSY52_05820 [Tepiditoga spiralis]